MKMLGTQGLCAYDLKSYDLARIKRVRILRRADGDYVQFCVNAERSEPQDPTGRTIGLDMGLKQFYTDSNGDSVDSPKFLRQAERKIKRVQRKHSRKVKGSANRRKSKNRLGRVHLKVQRQRKDFAIKLARCVVKSNDFVALEDLQVLYMVKNHCLAKSMSDAAWSLFANYLGYYGSVFGRPVVKVPPHYTSQDCFWCGRRVLKSLVRTHAHLPVRVRLRQRPQCGIEHTCQRIGNGIKAIRQFLLRSITIPWDTGEWPRRSRGNACGEWASAILVRGEVSPLTEARSR